MSNVQQNLSAAIRLHQAGRLEEAEQVYRQILTEQPGHPDALHLLGLVTHQTGRSTEAIKLIQAALEARPEFPDAHANLGLVYRQLGQVELAIESLRRALKSEPDSAEWLHNLGAALLDAQRPQEAIAHLNRAVVLNPQLAEAWNGLGFAHHQLRNHAEEKACYERAVAIDPTLASAHLSLGLVLQQEGKIDDAISCFQQAVNLKPNYTDAYFGLGFALHDKKQLDEAATAYRQVISLEPTSVRALNNLATVLLDQGKSTEAISCLRRADEIAPNSAEIQYSLGQAFKADSQLAKSEHSYRRAIDLKPEFPEALNNLGTLLSGQQSLAEAASCFRRAIELRPKYGDAYHNLGNALMAQGLLDESGACYRRAIALMSNPAEPSFSESARKLLTGNLQQGWVEYEARWHTGQIPIRSFPFPAWNGENLAEKTILLHAEQGFGDTLQFIRYASVVKNLGATVIVECQPQLTRLLTSQPSIDRLIPEGDNVPKCDFHAPLLSLPRIVKTTLESIPALVPYLFAKPALIAYWREKLSSVRGFRIGINWHGRTGTLTSHRRDIPLALFESLSAIPGIQLISLQKSTGPNQSVGARQPSNILHLSDFDTAHGPFMDTAAIMHNLDLVISSDTSIAHLAGALGLPTWVPLPFAPDWRWLLHRSDSPWYPTMRLFRQRSVGNWEGVFSEIKNVLPQYL